ncbi:MAG TPA: efflux RND transporter periplasmic adaptor subunit [Isosphaeraceae bacterium]|jgi:RND family efflux transporter MFP subunit|nr:efflux RND transporter periplasmic adaptor subunit [Isosphaeraceae bacterium]
MRYLFLGLCLGLAGCARAPSGAPQAAPTAVAVSRPVERDVTDFADFTGRVAAVDSVELRARVWGYLDKVNFKEGGLVQKGDVLFEIDPLTYRAALDLAEGNLASMQARLLRLNADLARAQRLLERGAISREEYDKVAGDRGEAAASREAMKGAEERAKLDLHYTKVTAPISGRVSRYVVTVGNVVQAGDQGGTLLTTIVSVDPMYVYFDMDEHTVLRLRQLVREGKADSPGDGGAPVWLGLANEDGYRHEGTINFVDNQVNPRTGTMRMRGVFPNGDQALTPGLFARVRVPIGRPHKALLVSDRALDTDQGQKVLYVLSEKNAVVCRPVRLGALHDGLREITEGLKLGERVIVNGLQQVRPGDIVEPKVVDARVALAAANIPKSAKP